jgi:hypothetical protein
MRFAKLEQNILLAFFVAYFDDIQLLDSKRKPASRAPDVNRNNWTARKPDEQVYLKYKLRD